MKIAYFDCFSGISGDMILGALLDAGLPLEDLNREIAKLGVQDVAIERESTARHAIAATRAKVCVAGAPLADAEHHLDLSGEPTHDHPHAHLKDITSRIAASRLDDVVKERSIRVFERLCAAEAEVHNATPAEVGLHEVGALDALIDVVGAVAGLQLLEIEEVCASPLRFGTGFVRCAHGRYPVPVPGVLALCRDVPTEQTDIRAELVTPTGAAIITTLARSFGPQPPFCQQAVGYGAGRRDLEAIPNLLRLRLGERVSASERVLLIEANIDDMNPEVYGYLFDRLLEQGACDVYATPILMKKGRPGNVLSVLAPAGRLDELAAIVLQETTTIGLRYYGVERRVLERQIRAIATPYGEVNVKFSYLDGRRRAAPEYEDCARLAQQHQVPLLSVYEAARAAAIKE
ncbi:MAG: nickel pincer cofactor biosynthesis protein LarC [Gemmatimonadetes bacterium]|nr:nickel pincer cofactor biosynthesis protein LarC [Gemmatimonadota bacterium]MYC72828.1 nickel pincer cofactor biosynthesis protein LarC [Gemmatimonadota bacterium]